MQMNLAERGEGGVEATGNRVQRRVGEGGQQKVEGRGRLGGKGTTGRERGQQVAGDRSELVSRRSEGALVEGFETSDDNGDIVGLAALEAVALAPGADAKGRVPPVGSLGGRRAPSNAIARRRAGLRQGRCRPAGLL